MSSLRHTQRCQFTIYTTSSSKTNIIEEFVFMFIQIKRCREVYNQTTLLTSSTAIRTHQNKKISKYVDIVTRIKLRLMSP